MPVFVEKAFSLLDEILHTRVVARGEYDGIEAVGGAICKANALWSIAIDARFDGDLAGLDLSDRADVDHRRFAFDAQLFGGWQVGALNAVGREVADRQLLHLYADPVADRGRKFVEQFGRLLGRAAVEVARHDIHRTPDG